MPFNWLIAVALVASSLTAAMIALFLFSLLPVRQRSPAGLLRPDDEEAVFLFDEDLLVDASQSARTLLTSCPARNSEWERLSAFLAPKIENFSSRIQQLAEAGRIDLTSADDPPLRVHAEMRGPIARITIEDPSREGCGRYVDSLSRRASEEELAAMRRLLEQAPVAIWREDRDGAVDWVNASYLRLLEPSCPDADATVWPLPVLFEPHAVPPNRQEGESRRLRIGGSEGAPEHWFECHSLPDPAGTLHYAIPADDTVRAESALREFIQTLTKTFAHLPIGLAIFDRDRRLALFNPALTDLTSVGPEFLSARPTLFAFLDRLREKQMIPEPKDYRSWRQMMTDLERAATNGHVEETWNLLTGQTYRVTGRPHPDGAVAFLFEDISAEISLTRRFRTELELGQEVVDSLDEAIAVFSPAGVLLMSNDAYAKLWGIDPGATLGEISITDGVRHWQALTRPNALWPDLHDFVVDMAEFGERAEWTRMAEMKDGRRMTVRVRPLSGGTTLVGFAEAPLSRLIRRARVRSKLRESA